MTSPLRFHWRLPLGKEVPGRTRTPVADLEQAARPSLDDLAAFCRLAEDNGIDSLLTAFAYYMPDPMVLAAALAAACARVKFMIAHRPGLISPTLFVQQINTAALLSHGRTNINLVIGHSDKEARSYGDPLGKSERCARADEFLTICRGLWRNDRPVTFKGSYYETTGAELKTPFLAPDRKTPELFVGGESPGVSALAFEHADCWLLMADRPETLAPKLRPALDRGLEVGLRASIILRASRAAAVEAGRAMVAAADPEWIKPIFERKSGADPGARPEATKGGSSSDQDWLTPALWRGAVATHGPSSIALVGTPSDIASAIMDYRSIGVSQFILSGWPNIDAVADFGRSLLPLIREREASDRGTDAAAK